MTYIEFSPRPDLAHIVKCVWNYEAPAGDLAGRPDRIVPDGNPELIVHYGHPFAELTPANGLKTQPRVFVIGQITRPLSLDSSQGAAGIVGVRFRPAGVRAIVGAAMDEFVNRHLRLEDIVPDLASSLLDQIACAPDPRTRTAIIQDFLAVQVQSQARFQDPHASDWTKRLARANGRLSVLQLARDAGLSTRQLERRFASQVGITPRLYANIIRFRTVFDRLTNGAQPDWANMASSAGYYDQSHMIRDFQRFLGCSPTVFLSQLAGISAVLVGLDEDQSCRVVTRRQPGR